MPEPEDTAPHATAAPGGPVVDVTLFTDPACPFAFSFEPVRRTLLWRYGTQLRWTPRMIVLTREEGEAENLASPFDGLQRKHGMPIVHGPSARPASSEPACRAVVAVRRHAPEAAEPLLRRLRVRTMAGGLLDDPRLIAAAATDAGLDPAGLQEWVHEHATGAALEDDVDAARDPTRAARALAHRLGGPDDEPRYSAPSLELRRTDGDGAASVPGFNPTSTYEIVFANLAPELERRPAPEDVGELLRWAGEPLATAEVAAVMELHRDEAEDPAGRRRGAGPGGRGRLLGPRRRLRSARCRRRLSRPARRVRAARCGAPAATPRPRPPRTGRRRAPRRPPRGRPRPPTAGPSCSPGR
jgi:2-hydroxychromene-2-carboxylate isomerase